MVRVGRGSRRLPLRVRCEDCGEVGLPCDARSQSRLIPSSGRGACLVKQLRQLLALLLGRPLTCDAVLVCPLIRICMPRCEHLVVVAGDLGHQNRRCPAHAPATLADLIWSFHLNTRFLACVGQRSMCRLPCPAQPGGWPALRKIRRPERGRSLRFDGNGGSLLRLEKGWIEVELRSPRLIR